MRCRVRTAIPTRISEIFTVFVARALRRAAKIVIVGADDSADRSGACEISALFAEPDGAAFTG